jgi:hypothetical protein
MCTFSLRAEIAESPWATRSRDQVSVGARFPVPVQTAPAVLKAFCATDTGQGVALTAHLSAEVEERVDLYSTSVSSLHVMWCALPYVGWRCFGAFSWFYLPKSSETNVITFEFRSRWKLEKVHNYSTVLKFRSQVPNFMEIWRELEHRAELHRRHWVTHSFCCTHLEKSHICAM